MAREGENAGQPFNAELEAAILRAKEGRRVRTDYEFDAQRRLVTVIATPLPDPTDLSLTPPEPVRVSLTFAHLKAAVGAIYQDEAGALHAQAGAIERQGAPAEQVAHLRGVSEIKAKLAGKLVAESESELETMRRVEAENRERSAQGSKGTLTPPAKRQLPGFDV